MPRLLEVIVTSLHEALEAEAGGADRLELVRSLEDGGLTPDFELARQIVGRVSIPVRVMLRENASMSSGGPAEVEILRLQAKALAQLPIDGLVIGFVREGLIDSAVMRRIFETAPNCHATFHRAFEHADDPLAAIRELKRIPQIDRILTRGGEGAWSERKKRLLEWQQAAAPEIGILVGIGLSRSIFSELKRTPSFVELHAGRAARTPPTISGIVDRARVAALKSALL